MTQKAGGQHVHKWVKPNSTTRNEVLDCTVGALWGLEMLAERYRDINQLWTELDRRLVQPDFFAVDVLDDLPASTEDPIAVPVVLQDGEPANADSGTQPKPVPTPPVRRRAGAGLGRDDWLLR